MIEKKLIFIVLPCCLKGRIFIEAVSIGESSADTRLGIRRDFVSATKEKAAKRQQQPLSAKHLVGIIRDDAAVKTH